MATLRLNPALAKAWQHADAARSGPGLPAPDPGNALGDWALARVHSRPHTLIVAVSCATRWAFALPAAPLPTLLARFGPALLQSLLALGVPPDRARHEIDRSEPWQLGRGIDRSVARHLTQYAESVVWAAGEGLGLGAINARLSDHLILRPREGYPAEEVLRLLGGNPALVMQRQQDQHHAARDQRGDRPVGLNLRHRAEEQERRPRGEHRPHEESDVPRLERLIRLRLRSPGQEPGGHQHHGKPHRVDHHRLAGYVSEHTGEIPRHAVHDARLPAHVAEAHPAVPRVPQDDRQQSEAQADRRELVGVEYKRPELSGGEADA